MQTACIEFARNVCGLDEANSSEFDPATPHRVIYKLRELSGVEELGGTMRLGAWPCKLEAGSFAAKAYGKHRNQRTSPPPLRIQPRIRSSFYGAGLNITGTTPMAPTSRLSNCPTIPTSSAASSIPSSSRSLWSRIRSSSASSKPATSTAPTPVPGRPGGKQPVPPPRRRRQTLTYPDFARKRGPRRRTSFSCTEAMPQAASASLLFAHLHRQIPLVPNLFNQVQLRFQPVHVVFLVLQNPLKNSAVALSLSSRATLIASL